MVNPINSLCSNFWDYRYVIGSKMSGNMDYSLRPIHAHILLVGWLSVFAWGIFYKVYTVKYKKLVSIHAITAMLGAVGSNIWYVDV